MLVLNTRYSTGKSFVEEKQFEFSSYLFFRLRMGNSPFNRIKAKI